MLLEGWTLVSSIGRSIFTRWVTKVEKVSCHHFAFFRLNLLNSLGLSTRTLCPKSHLRSKEMCHFTACQHHLFFRWWGRNLGLLSTQLTFIFLLCCKIRKQLALIGFHGLLLFTVCNCRVKLWSRSQHFISALGLSQSLFQAADHILFLILLLFTLVGGYFIHTEYSCSCLHNPHLFPFFLLVKFRRLHWCNLKRCLIFLLFECDILGQEVICVTLFLRVRQKALQDLAHFRASTCRFHANYTLCNGRLLR